MSLDNNQLYKELENLFVTLREQARKVDLQSSDFKIPIELKEKFAEAWNSNTKHCVEIGDGHIKLYTSEDSSENIVDADLATGILAATYWGALHKLRKALKSCGSEANISSFGKDFKKSPKKEFTNSKNWLKAIADSKVTDELKEVLSAFTTDSEKFHGIKGIARPDFANPAICEALGKRKDRFSIADQIAEATTPDLYQGMVAHIDSLEMEADLDRIHQAFVNICEFCAWYENHGAPIKTNDAECNSACAALEKIADFLGKEFTYYRGIQFSIKYSKGSGNFPRVPWLAILPPGQSPKNGAYYSLCFGREGNGAVAGFAVSVSNPDMFETIERDKGDISINVNGGDPKQYYNNTFVNPLEIAKDNFTWGSFVSHIRESLDKAINLLGLKRAAASKNNYHAYPFSKIFVPGKADIALDHFAKSLEVISRELGADSQVVSVNLTKNSKSRYGITMNLGNWAVTGISGTSGKLFLLLPASHPESNTSLKGSEPFADDIDNQHYSWLELAVEDYELRAGEIWPTYETALVAACKHFKDWKKSPYRKHHNDTIAELIMDEDKRSDILDEGIPEAVAVVQEDPSDYNTETQYWWLNANPKIWDFMNMKVGERQEYTAKNEKGNKRQKYKYFERARPGDLVLGYLTTPAKQLVSLCQITKGLSETNGNSIEFEKVEDFAHPLSWEDLQSMPELENCEPIQSNQGSLFKVSPEEYDFLRSVIDDLEENTANTEPYSRKEALEDLFMSDKDFDNMLDLLQRKKNIILQGAPGVGKTFVARRLAYTLMKEKNQDRAPMIQFHQSYAYEDFIQGYRPDGDGGFRLANGAFYKLCQQAQRDPNRDYFLIIDEINRGNLSKIFGELMMLMEADKRGPAYALQLSYSRSPDDVFYIPENIHLIGTMNTADRSLAMVDYALRRRFAFIDLAPEFNSSKFQKTLKAGGADSTMIDKIVTRMNELNQSIFDDARNLGRGYRIGHSFFCPDNGKDVDDDWYEQVIKYEIAPLLREYWLDDESRAQSQIEKLQAN